MLYCIAYSQTKKNLYHNKKSLSIKYIVLMFTNHKQSDVRYTQSIKLECLSKSSCEALYNTRYKNSGGLSL